jgi:hypothetical protein
MPDWLFDLSIWQAMMLSVVLFVGGTWAGVVLVRPILRLFALKQADWPGDALVAGRDGVVAEKSELRRRTE